MNLHKHAALHNNISSVYTNDRFLL